jgi:chemotaxis protein MotB
MSARRKKHAAHEEHENHERWLITYADMITLLMVLFIVLYSISQVDVAKYEELKSGMTEGFGGEAAVLDGGTGVMDHPSPAEPETPDPGSEAFAAQEAAFAAEQQTLNQAAQTIDQQMAAAGFAGAVGFRMEERGLVVTIVTDRILFQPGSDALRPEADAVLHALAGALSALPNRITIDGHTDNVPISNARFASNWELSTARATSVLRALIERYGIAPSRLGAAGYGDQRPVAPNDSPAGRAANRRVEIVVYSTVQDPTPRGT